MAAKAGSLRSRVLLVSANRCTTPEPVFPLGLAHLNAALRRSGHEVHWVDLLFEPQRVRAELAEFSPLLVGISIRNIDDVLAGKREMFIDGLRELVAEIHQQAGCPVILGGSGFSIFPRELLEWTGADYGLVGEAEHSLVLLVENLGENRLAFDIPGLVFRRDGETIVNAPANHIPAAELEQEDWPPRLISHYL